MQRYAICFGIAMLNASMKKDRQQVVPTLFRINMLLNDGSNYQPVFFHACMHQCQLYKHTWISPFPSLNFNFHRWEPRTYPPHFVLRLVKLFPFLVENKSPAPEIPASFAEMETKDFFDGLPWGDDVWEDADMVSCLAYVRGNRDLNIGEWRDSFPEALWPYVTISYGGDAISSNKHVALATFLP